MVPVVAISLLLNVTKFLEVQLRWETDPSTNETYPTYGPTELRLSKDYVR